MPTCPSCEREYDNGTHGIHACEPGDKLEVAEKLLARAHEALEGQGFAGCVAAIAAFLGDGLSATRVQKDQGGFARNLAALMRARGASGVEIEKATGVHNTTISRWKNGERNEPSARELAAVARYLGTTVEALLSDTPIVRFSEKREVRVARLVDVSSEPWRAEVSDEGPKVWQILRPAPKGFKGEPAEAVLCDVYPTDSRSAEENARMLETLLAGETLSHRRGVSEDGSVGYDLVHDDGRRALVTFSSDGDIEAVLTKKVIQL